MAKSKKNEAAENYDENLPADEVAAPKKTPFCTVTTDEAGVTHFSFGNGKDVSINPNELSEEQQRNLMYHGLVQKVRDSFSSAKGDYAFGEAAAEKVVQNLKDDKWTASRETGESKPKTTELAQALANLKGLDLAVVQAAVEKADEAKRSSWRKNAQVAAEIAAIRAANARKRAEASTASDSLADLEV